MKFELDDCVMVVTTMIPGIEHRHARRIAMVMVDEHSSVEHALHIYERAFFLPPACTCPGKDQVASWLEQKLGAQVATTYKAACPACFAAWMQEPCTCTAIECRRDREAVARVN